MKAKFKAYNENCITGCVKHIEDNSVDLIITDPPYGIDGDTLHKHYNRNEEYVLDGYVEISKEKYSEFSKKWISQAERILKPGGSIYIISGYTNLLDILIPLRNSKLKEINHIIWKYNFGVYTKKKYVSSHYHILFYEKPGGNRTFNINSRFGLMEKTDKGGSLNYKDREDVWIINREYKPGQVKNKNELPTQLLIKLIQYSSNEGDTVCDLFLGSFSTMKIAVGLNRNALGFELSKTAFNHQLKEMKKIIPGNISPMLRIPEKDSLSNQGKKWADDDINNLLARYKEIKNSTQSKKAVIEILSKEFGRGRFSIEKILKLNDVHSVGKDTLNLFED